MVGKFECHNKCDVNVSKEEISFYAALPRLPGFQTVYITNNVDTLLW